MWRSFRDGQGGKQKDVTFLLFFPPKTTFHPPNESHEENRRGRQKRRGLTLIKGKPVGPRHPRAPTFCATALEGSHTVSDVEFSLGYLSRPMSFGTSEPFRRVTVGFHVPTRLALDCKAPSGVSKGESLSELPAFDGSH